MPDVMISDSIIGAYLRDPAKNVRASRSALLGNPGGSLHELTRITLLFASKDSRIPRRLPLPRLYSF